MKKTKNKASVPHRFREKAIHLSRGQRIHRRRALTLQRRQAEALTVTTRE
jgi:hypothetical protein